MILIVGLGNPGKEYALSRHNIGFRCLDRFSSEHGIEMRRKRAKALVGSGTVDGVKVILAKPQTFMNNSGDSIQLLLHENGLLPQDLVVVYDDMDLPLGKVRIRPGGSAGGHHGIESTIRMLSCSDFPRVRVGIGRPNNHEINGINHVLGRFYPDEEKTVEEAISQVSKALHVFLVGGMDKAMNQFNREPENKVQGSAVRPGKGTTDRPVALTHDSEGSSPGDSGKLPG
jgi:PTH1 family peptidyl-tRNA hydrolase